MSRINMTQYDIAISNPPTGEVSLYADAKGNIIFIDNSSRNISVLNGKVDYSEVTATYNVTRKDQNRYLEAVFAVAFTANSLTSFDVGTQVTIKNSSSENISFDPYLSETIEGQPFIIIAPSEAITILALPNEWQLVSRSSSLSPSNAVFTAEAVFQDGLRVAGGDLILENADLYLTPGRIFADTGHASEPSVSFAADPSTGSYLANTGAYAISASGAEVIQFTAGGITSNVSFLLPDGTQFKPPLAFKNAQNYGIYRVPSDGSMGFAGNGIAALRVDDYGLKTDSATNVYVGADITWNRNKTERLGKIEIGGANSSTFIGADNEDDFVISQNTTSGVSPEFTTSLRDAFKLTISNNNGLEFKGYEGSGASSGNPISWDKLAQIDFDSLKYKDVAIATEHGAKANSGLSINRPTAPAPGTLYLSTDTDRMEIYTGDFWTGASSSYSHITSTIPPSAPKLGDTWFDSTNSILFFYTNTGGRDFWLDITSSGGGGSAGGGSFYTGTLPPSSPAPVPGDRWHNTTTGTLYMYDFDGNTGAWRDISGSSPVGVYATENAYIRSVAAPATPAYGDIWHSPATGDISIYEDDGAGSGNWRVIYDASAYGITQYAQATTPSSVNRGDLWYDTANDQLSLFAFDGTTSAWRNISSPQYGTKGISAFNPNWTPSLNENHYFQMTITATMTMNVPAAMKEGDSFIVVFVNGGVPPYTVNLGAGLQTSTGGNNVIMSNAAGSKTVLRGTALSATTALIEVIGSGITI